MATHNSTETYFWTILQVFKIIGGEDMEKWNLYTLFWRERYPGTLKLIWYIYDWVQLRPRQVLMEKKIWVSRDVPRRFWVGMSMVGSSRVCANMVDLIDFSLVKTPRIWNNRLILIYRLANLLEVWQTYLGLARLGLKK